MIKWGINGAIFTACVAGLCVFSGIAQPIAFTRGANRIGSTSARLNGVVISGDRASQAWFEWGLVAGLDQSSPAMAVPSGEGLVQVAFTATNFLPREVYSCRLVVSNEHGITHGARRLFTTGRKITTWGDNTYNQLQVPAATGNTVALAAGEGHLLALQTDGSIVAGGQNTLGQTAVPPNATNVIALYANQATSMALREDGLLVGWGGNSHGQLDIPADATNVVAFDMSGGQCVAVRGDGTLVGWGTQTNGPGPVPAWATNIVEVACGPFRNLALRADGTLLEWPGPAPGDISNVVAIAAGPYAHLAVLADGTVRSWDASGTLLTNAPPDLTNTVFVSAGNSHYLALSAAGSVSGWGDTNSGALAIPAGIEPVAKLVAGPSYSAAVGANLPPQGGTAVADGLPNQDVMIPLSASDANGDPLQLRIVSLPDSGTLYQYDNGARGSAITSPGTGISDPGWRVLFAPETNAAGVPYARFRFTANDGEVDALAVAEMTVNIDGRAAAHALHPAVIQPTAVTLAGMGLARGLPAVAWFEWGTNAQERTAPVELGSGNKPVYVQATVGPLQPGVSYLARLAVSNSQGVVLSHPRVFTTGLKVHAWGRSDQGAATPPPGTSRVIHVAGSQSSATSGQFSVAVRDNGTLVAWGTNTVGQLSVPPGVTNAVMVAAGGAHGLALRSDGSVVSWGNTNNGLQQLPTGLTNVVEVAAGQHHSLALTRSGKVIAWGYNQSGPTNVPPDLDDAVAIAAYDFSSFALRADGKVLRWGSPGDREITNAVALSGKHAILRDGSVVPLGPDFAPAGTNYLTIASGYNHALGCLGNRTVVAVGNNLYGALNVPTDLHEVAVIGAGRDHSLAIAANARPEAMPSLVAIREGIDKVVQLRGSDRNSDGLAFRVTALPARGSLYQYEAGGRGAAITATNTWVSDNLGQLIFVSGEASPDVPYDMFEFQAHDGEDFSGTASVALYKRGEQFATTALAYAIDQDRMMCGGFVTPNGYPTYAWFEVRTNGGAWQVSPLRYVGTNFGVQWLTQAVTTLARRVPHFYRLVASNETGVTVAGEKVFGRGRSLAMWGANDRFQRWSYVDPVDYVAVACGTAHTLALRSDGKVSSWEESGNRMQGVPTNLNNVIALAAVGNASVVLKRDGTVAGWGFGQTTVFPASANNLMAVAVGAYHSVALRTSGLVVCWGNNQYGQTNIPKGLSNVVAVAAGQQHSLALKHDGTVVAWGLNNGGQTSVPPWLNEVVGITAAGSCSFALRRDGQMVSWGSGTGVGVPPPAAASPCLALASSGGYDLALRPDLTVVGWGTNSHGQTNIPAGLASVVSIGAGDRHAVALSAEPIAPYANSLPAMPHEQDGFRFTGFVTPNDEAVTAWFEWGTVTNFDRVVGVTNLDAARGFTCVSAVLREIEAGVVYNYRIVASNQFGVTRGGIPLFGLGNRLVYWGKLYQPGALSFQNGMDGMVAIAATGGVGTRALFSGGTLLQRYPGTSSMTGVAAFAASGYGNAGLLSDGRVLHESFPNMNQGSSQVALVTSNGVAVAGCQLGATAFLALHADGSVMTWATAPAAATTLSNFTDIVGIATASTSYYGAYATALRSDGRVLLGTPSLMRMVIELTNVASVAAIPVPTAGPMPFARMAPSRRSPR